VEGRLAVPPPIVVGGGEDQSDSQTRIGIAPVGEWRDDDYDVLENGIVVGRIFKVPVRLRSSLDVGERPQWRYRPRGARLRADARGRDGRILQELAQKLGTAMRARHRRRPRQMMPLERTGAFTAQTGRSMNPAAGVRRYAFSA
jgi:hypothetical protein